MQVPWDDSHLLACCFRAFRPTRLVCWRSTFAAHLAVCVSTGDCTRSQALMPLPPRCLRVLYRSILIVCSYRLYHRSWAATDCAAAAGQTHPFAAHGSVCAGRPLAVRTRARGGGERLVRYVVHLLPLGGRSVCRLRSSVACFCAVVLQPSFAHVGRRLPSS